MRTQKILSSGGIRGGSHRGPLGRVCPLAAQTDAGNFLNVFKWVLNGVRR